MNISTSLNITFFNKKNLILSLLVITTGQLLAKTIYRDFKFD